MRWPDTRVRFFGSSINPHVGLCALQWHIVIQSVLKKSHYSLMVVNVLLYLPEFIFKETECCCTYSKNPDLPVLGPPLACGLCPEVGLRAPDDRCGTITMTRERGVFRNMCSVGSVGWCGASTATRHPPPAALPFPIPHPSGGEAVPLQWSRRPHWPLDNHVPRCWR